MAGWNCVLTLNPNRDVVGGSEEGLAAAIRRGADLRIGTDFRYNEHLSPGSDNAELIREVSDFRATYLLADRWVAGLMTLRMPIASLDGFGPRPSMSFFLYNQNGQQAIARPFLDGRTPSDDADATPDEDVTVMPKMHVQGQCDLGSNAPSSNFIYDFENYRFLVRDQWQEVFANGPDGETVSGSLDALTQAFFDGADLKVAVHGLCADLTEDAGAGVEHECLVHCGPGYYETETGRFAAAAHPTVRVRPGIPLTYTSRGWDFGWLLVRTDGVVFRWLCDPLTLTFHKSERRHAVRWFVG